MCTASVPLAVSVLFFWDFADLVVEKLSPVRAPATVCFNFHVGVILG